MQSIDVLLDATREFLHQIAAFLPRLLLALLVVAVGWLFAKAVRFTVERALRAVNFNVLTERAGTDNFLRQAGMRGIPPRCSESSPFGWWFWQLSLSPSMAWDLLYYGPVGPRRPVHAKNVDRDADRRVRFVLCALRGQRRAILLRRCAYPRRRYAGQDRALRDHDFRRDDRIEPGLRSAAISSKEPF